MFLPDPGDQIIAGMWLIIQQHELIRSSELLKISLLHVLPLILVITFSTYNERFLMKQYRVLTNYSIHTSSSLLPNKPPTRTVGLFFHQHFPARAKHTTRQFRVNISNTQKEIPESLTNPRQVRQITTRTST